MDRSLKLLLMGFTCLLFAIACRKEKSFEAPPPAKGSLQSNAGTCMEKTRFGTFIANKQLRDTNYVDVAVRVTRPGGYTVQTTQLVNGYSFKGTGTFSDTGLKVIRLVASGKPILPQTDVFTIVFDSSTCSFEIPVVLGSGPNGTCNAILAGAYNKTYALNAANTVSIQHNYAAAGTYNVTTNTENGYSFSANVTVTAPGVQTIVLNGTGTPGNAQTDNFIVNFGDNTATCGFSVVVGANTPPPPPPNGLEYFPLTATNWWSYDVVTSAPDTITRRVAGTKTINGNVYTRVNQLDETATLDDSAFFRKAGTDYFQYTEVDSWSSFFAFDAPAFGDILFLKEALTTGQTWNSAEFTGTVATIPTKLRYKFTVVDADAVETIGGKTFNNVYKITMQPETSVATAPFMGIGETWTFYYVRGLGLVYEKLEAATVTVVHLEIRNWQVQ